VIIYSIKLIINATFAFSQCLLMSGIEVREDLYQHEPTTQGNLILFST